jgi:hypothetical protein
VSAIIAAEFRPGTITKRPRVRGPLFFYAFRAASGLSQTPNLARVPLLYVPFDFFLAFFFMTLFLAVGPLSQSKQWQQADERGVNRSWQRGNNIPRPNRSGASCGGLVRQTLAHISRSTYSGRLRLPCF